MHFATANIDKFNKDGAIWVVDYVAVHDHLPAALKDQLNFEGAIIFTVEMLSDVVTSLEAFSTIVNQSFALFFEPPSMDDQIVNRYALFSRLTHSVTDFDHWLKGVPRGWRKIIIPAELKWEIRDKLDQSNITERVLFPGLDGLSRWLTRHYSPKRRSVTNF
jgi:hypothetical protein